MAKVYRQKSSSKSPRTTTFIKNCFVLAIVIIASFAPLLMALPVAADNAGDVEKGLINQGYYISTVAKTKLVNPTASATTLKDTVSKLKNEKHLGALAILDNATIATNISSGDPVAFADYLRNYLNPKVDIVVVVNGDQQKVGLSAKNLTPAEDTAITDAARSTFTAGNFAEGTQQIALAAADKISSKQTSQTLTTVGIVVVVILLIAGGLTYLLISTKNSWNKQLRSLQDLNSRVSDLVVRVSEGIDYLPDATREQVRSNFGRATANMSEAQANMRTLEKASAIQLVFSGGKFRQQLNNTGSELQGSYNTLQQLERSVEKI